MGRRFNQHGHDKVAAEYDLTSTGFLRTRPQRDDDPSAVNNPTGKGMPQKPQGSWGL
jgi:hypothetical protein